MLVLSGEAAVPWYCIYCIMEKVGSWPWDAVIQERKTDSIFLSYGRIEALRARSILYYKYLTKLQAAAFVVP